MRRPATSILALLLLASWTVHAAVPYERLRKVGDRVACQCSCRYTVGSCNMIRCHFRDPVLRQIEAGLEAGQSDDEVLEQIYAEFGSETRVEPRDEGFEVVGWIAPFVALLAGLTAIPWVVRRWSAGSKARSRGDSVPDDVVDRYRAEIEDDLEDFE